MNNFLLKKVEEGMSTNDKPVIARQPRAILEILYSFIVFSYYFTRLNACEVGVKNKRNSENICHFAIGTVR